MAYNAAKSLLMVRAPVKIAEGEGDYVDVPQTVIHLH